MVKTINKTKEFIKKIFLINFKVRTICFIGNKFGNVKITLPNGKDEIKKNKILRDHSSNIK